MNRVVLNVIFISALAMSSGFPGKSSAAEDLSATALFYRCYAQMTQSRPDRNSDRVQAVRNGSKDPITACLEILDSAKLNNTTGRTANNTVAKKVLKTFHNLHSSWFQAKQFPENFTFLRNKSNRFIHDSTSPGLYLTKALLNQDTKADYVLKTTENLVAIRANNNPATSHDNVTKGDVAFANNVLQFASYGELLGIRNAGVRNWPYSWENTRNNRTFSGTAAVGRNFGGGVLGSQAYLLLTVDEDQTFKSDGAVEMPRKWARNFITDFMCRELPLIRPNDADAFIVPTSDIEFRKAAACNRCHASMDRMASTMRNLEFFAISGQNVFAPRHGSVVARMRAVNRPAESGWPAVEDNNYANRPPKGRLFFRNYKGDLIDLPLNNVADLGNKLSQQDDVYICMASRYYKYFTGIKTFVGDIGDASLGLELTAQDIKQRNLVIQLGKNLKNHKDPRRLIEEIIKLPSYKKTDFGTTPERGLASE